MRLVRGVVTKIRNRDRKIVVKGSKRLFYIDMDEKWPRVYIGDKVKFEVLETIYALELDED